MSNSRKIKHEFLDAFALLGLRKHVKTTWHFIKNPRSVVESISNGKKEYVTPVRYLISIAAPVILILSFSENDLNHILVGYATGFASKEELADPAVRAAQEVALPTQMLFLRFYFGEFRPIFYAVFLAIPLAFFMWILCRDKDHRFYFFFSISYYTLGLALLAESVSLVYYAIFHLDLSDRTKDIYGVMVGLPFLVLFLYRSLVEGRLKRLAKAILSVFLVFIWANILLGFTIWILTSYALKNYHWISPLTMGESAIAVPMREASYVSTQYGLSADQVFQAVGKGLLVVSVEPFSPAEAVGLTDGDIITNVNGKTTITNMEYRIALDSLMPGDTVSLIVLRSRSPVKLNIPIFPRDSVFRPAKAHLGFKFRYLSDSARNVMSNYGVEVTDILRNSPAEKAGIKVGDLFVGFDGHSFQSKRDFQLARANYSKRTPGELVIVSVIRSKELMDIPLALEK